MKKSRYAAMFTLRKDGRYMGYYHDLDADGQPTGPRHAIYDRDPERLYRRIEQLETPGEHLLRDVADAWETRHRDEIKDRTWKNYAPHVADIKLHYGARPIAEISAADVYQDLQAMKARGYSFTVVNTRRSLWRQILDYAVAAPEIRLPYNVALGIKNPKGLQKGKRSAPDDDVIRSILDDAQDMDFGFIPFFLLCTGLRRSEALQRRTEDVNTTAWEISIPEAKTPSGVRTVPIIAPLRPPLQDWMAAHPGPWLFPRRDYYAGRKGRVGYMTDSNWETAWADYCAAHGWVDEEGKPTIGAHHLRHGTATLLYEAGVDVYTMRDVLGHADITTTLRIYTDLRKKYEAKNVRKFGGKVQKLLSKGGK